MARAEIRPMRVEWQGDKRFRGTDAAGSPVDIDPAQVQGVKPSELLPMALASCSGTDVIEELQSRGGVLESFVVEARSLRGIASPWPFTKIRLRYVVSATGVTTEDVEDAVRLSLGDRCTVAATLGSRVVIEPSIEFTPPSDSPVVHAAAEDMSS